MGGVARRTWFSSHMVMKRSKDRPPSTILNFWPVPSASAGARPARPTSNLYADGIVASCCYGILGDAGRQGGRSRCSLASSALCCFVFHPCPACRVRRRELGDRSIGVSLTMAIQLHSVLESSESFKCTNVK